MLGTLVGDAFGARFEGWDVIDRAHVDRWLAATDTLRFTDDTHMTIGVAESLLARGGFDGAHMTDTFARHFHAEPWRGYGPGPPQIFAAVERGVPWDEAAASMFGGTGSFGNGSAMRAAPAALFAYPDLATVASLARQTSTTTHTHLLGIERAVFQAVGVALAIGATADQPLDVDRFLARLGAELRAPAYQVKLTDIQALLPDAELSAVVTRLGHGVAAQSSVPTALYAFLRSPDSFVETICFAVSLGGDTDTIAAMAGGLAGAYVGEQGIPTALLDRTEAVEEVRGLADRLFARAALA